MYLFTGILVCPTLQCLNSTSSLFVDSAEQHHYLSEVLMATVFFRLWMGTTIRPANSTSLLCLCRVPKAELSSSQSTIIHLPSPNIVVAPWSSIFQHDKRFSFVFGREYSLQWTVLGPLISKLGIHRSVAVNNVAFANFAVIGVIPLTLVKYNPSLTPFSPAQLSTIISGCNVFLFCGSISLNVTNKLFLSWWSLFCGYRIARSCYWTYIYFTFLWIGSDFMLPLLYGTATVICKMSRSVVSKYLIGDRPQGRIVFLLSIFGRPVMAATGPLSTEIAILFAVSNANFNPLHSSTKILIA